MQADADNIKQCKRCTNERRCEDKQHNTDATTPGRQCTLKKTLHTTTVSRERLNKHTNRAGVRQTEEKSNEIKQLYVAWGHCHKAVTPLVFIFSVKVINSCNIKPSELSLS